MKNIIIILCFLFGSLIVSSANAQADKVLENEIRLHADTRPQHIAERWFNSKLYKVTRYPVKPWEDYRESLIYDEGDSDHGVHFENTRIELTWINTLEDLTDFSFKNCKFVNGSIFFPPDADFTDTLFMEGCDIKLTPQQLIQTQNYKIKILRCRRLFGDFPNVDFSDCEISCCFTAERLDGAKFHNTWFIDSLIPKGMTQEQFKQTRNYRTGIFLGVYNTLAVDARRDIKTRSIFQDLDISGMNFSFCKLGGSFSGTNMTDTVFTECYLTTVRDLTLEQVKSTWNYKAGRMSLCKWPEYIKKALEEEEKAKEVEEKK